MKHAPHPALLGLLIFSLLTHLIWIFAVGYIRDDAFITFRVASNLAAGRGFEFNLGQQVYAASSPGFALLMAGWLSLAPRLPVAGALLFGVLASLISLYILWRILTEMDLQVQHKIFISMVFILADRLLIRTLEGMENPLVITCMLASYYFFSRDRPWAAGIAAGMMLWLRIDSALWILALAVTNFTQFRKVATFFAAAFLTYSPWLIFAQLYYGHVIPWTAIAKQVAYSLRLAPAYQRAQVLLGMLTPVTIMAGGILSQSVATLVIVFAIIGAWAHRHNVFVRAAALFVFTQSITMITLNMQVEDRYIAPTLAMLQILFGLGLYRLAPGWPALASYAIAALALGWPRAVFLREYQDYVHEGSLQAMGQWLNEDTPEDSTIFLEPLGYIGYYSERRMLDEVGLVTPIIIPLKRAGIDPFTIATLLNPDYVIFHCDDARRAPEGFGYQLIVRVDPLDFVDQAEWHNPAVQRNACYEILERLPSDAPGKD